MIIHNNHANDSAIDPIQTEAVAAVVVEANGACLSSRELFSATNTVRIEHNGELYCLRLTRNNKLILTK